MRAIWLIALFTASAWLYLVPTFTPADVSWTSPAVFLLAACVLMASISLRRRIPRPFPPSVLLFAVPLGLLCFALPLPYNIGAVMMLAGLVANLPAFKFHRLAPISAAFLLTGFVLLVQAAFMPLFYVIASRCHEIKALNEIAYPLIRLFRLDASISEGIIYLPSFQDMTAFPGTLEKTGFYVLFNMFLCGMLLILVSDRSWKNLAKFVGICVGYLMLRYVFLIFIFAQVIRVEIYWHPVAQIFSFLPLGLLLCAVFPLETPSAQPPSPFPLRSDGLPALLFFISLFCLTGIFAFDDPGTRKQGRILIDETHSDWEWSTRKFDTTWFGSQSTYNYYCMAEYLNHFYAVSHNTDSALTDKRLAECDVLVLKTPTRQFEENEIQAVVSFVENGGGLWLIGDHTNVFGMNLYLNALAKKFGMFFHYDSTYDLDKGTLTYYERPVVLPHPVVMNMPPFLFATSCTMDAPYTGENIIVGYGLRSRLLDYAGRAFFESKPIQDYEFGLFLQAAGGHYGKGRVAAYTDSTCFSNFYMFIPGKPELALGSVEWLNRENRFSYLPGLFGIIALISFCGGVYIMRRERERMFPIWLFSALTAAGVGILLFSHLAKTAYAVPETHTPLKQVCFETAHSDFVLPVKALVDDHPKNYHTFFVWTQRMAYFPSLENDYADALKKGELVVIINPIRPFSPDEIAETVRFVENGGKLLVIDGPQNTASVSNPLLEPFGMKIDFTEIKESEVVNHEGDFLGTVQQSGSVKGGDAFILTKFQKPIFSVTGKGKGTIGVMADSHLFANPQMGGTQVRPDEKLQRIYDLEFLMIDVVEQYGKTRPN